MGAGVSKNESSEKVLDAYYDRVYRFLEPKKYRYKVLYGGRGSGKSHTIAACLLLIAQNTKIRVLCTREIQNSIRDSVWRLLRDKIQANGWDDRWEITNDEIRCITTGSEFIFKGLRNNPSIKSTEGISYCWCFPKGTLVDGMPIESIKPGDFVRSFNHRTETVELRRVLRVMKRPTPEKMYKMTLLGVKEPIVSTGEHPFFVKGRGYVPMSKISKGDIVYACKTGYSEFGSMFGRMRGNDGDRYKNAETAVCEARRYLLQGLRQENVVRADEEKQSDVRPFNPSEDENRVKSEGQASENPRWERSWLNTRSDSVVVVARSRMVAGTSDTDRGEGKRNPDKLQGGHCKHLVWDCDRDRRWQSQRSNFESRGCTEKPVLEEQRVERVEVQEQRSTERDGKSESGDFVFNLEVEGNNNYFAWDVLVHNCEEAQLISQESWNVLIPTIRGAGSEIWISFNPDVEETPVWQMFVAHHRDNALVEKVNWDGNPWFPEELREEKDYLYRVDPGMAANVWGGELRSNTNASIFKGKYAVEAFPDDLYQSAERLFFGADFGFANDPSALVRCFIIDKVLYIDYEAYGFGVEISELAKLFRTVPDVDSWTIKADCARPETISHLAKVDHLNIVAAPKWKESVREGIEFIRSFEKVIIHPRCVHTADEFRHYSWKTDRITGEILNVPEDKNNHCIDSARYSLSDYIQHKGQRIHPSNLRLLRR